MLCPVSKVSVPSIRDIAGNALRQLGFVNGGLGAHPITGEVFFTETDVRSPTTHTNGIIGVQRVTGMEPPPTLLLLLRSLSDEPPPFNWCAGRDRTRFRPLFVLRREDPNGNLLTGRLRRRTIVSNFDRHEVCTKVALCRTQPKRGRSIPVVRQLHEPDLR